MTSDSPVEVAKRRVIDARARVLVQEKRIAEALREGRNTGALENTLEALKRALEIFEKDYEMTLFNGPKQ
ncbi:MAG: hypothetical protein AB7E79_06595 [Rhodospirillaceae bacterium]